MQKQLKNIVNIPKYLVVSLIGVYQLLLSPDHSWLKSRFPHGYCRFYPSCSQYAKEAVGKFGVLKGGYLGVKRILRCNPFVKPGVDVVSHNF